MQKCTLLIQGKINDETFNLWIKNYKDWKVVVSVWEDEDISKFDIPKKWKVVLGTYPKKRFMVHGNLDYQIITTINGLRNINTEWVIKVRADEYWSNLESVLDMSIKNENKIVSSSMFFRRWGLYDFHCGDKILAGKKENIELMFNIAYNIAKQDVLNCVVPETYLGLGFLVGKKEILFNDKFILSLNNKDAKFDRNSSFQAMKAAVKAINKDFEHIFDKKKTIDIASINEKLKHAKQVVEYCINYNELVDKFKNRIDIQEIEKDLMKKYFEIIDINELKPYIATRNYGGEIGRVWYRDNFDNKKENCLSSINEK